MRTLPRMKPRRKVAIAFCLSAVWFSVFAGLNIVTGAWDKEYWLAIKIFAVLGITNAILQLLGEMLRQLDKWLDDE